MTFLWWGIVKPYYIHNTATSFHTHTHTHTHTPGGKAGKRENDYTWITNSKHDIGYLSIKQIYPVCLYAYYILVSLQNDIT